MPKVGRPRAEVGMRGEPTGDLDGGELTGLWLGLGLRDLILCLGAKLFSTGKLKKLVAVVGVSRVTEKLGIGSKAAGVTKLDQ